MKILEFKKWLVNEVHYTDTYSKGFEDFRKKYISVVKQKMDSNLYVQFTNNASSTLEKSAYPNPDHTDPVGVYAYPLKYVIQHPADIWYGKNARYLRVLQSQSKNPLFVYGMSKQQAESILWKMGLDPNLLSVAKKHYKHTGINQWAKSLFSAFQMELENKPEPDEWKMLRYKVRSNLEQTQLLLKAGYDAVIDTSHATQQAVINEREPEQIIFLKRNAFKPIEIFTLFKNNPVLADFQPNKEGRKLVAMTLEALGDQIVSGPIIHDLASLFWSRKGKRISVAFVSPQSHYNGPNHKRHKEAKLSNSYEINLVIEHSEKGKIGFRFDSSEKFQDIAYEMRNAWNQRENIPNFQPETYQKWKTEQDHKEKARKEDLNKKYDQEIEEKNEDAKQNLRQIAQLLNVPITFSEKLDYDNAVEKITRKIHDLWHKANTSVDDPENIKYVNEGIEEYRDISDAALSEDGNEFINTLLRSGYIPRQTNEEKYIDQFIRLIKSLYAKDINLVSQFGTYLLSRFINSTK